MPDNTPEWVYKDQSRRGWCVIAGGVIAFVVLAWPKKRGQANLVSEQVIGQRITNEVAESTAELQKTILNLEAKQRTTETSLLSEQEIRQRVENEVVKSTAELRKTIVALESRQKLADAESTRLPPKKTHFRGCECYHGSHEPPPIATRVKFALKSH